MAVLFGVYGHRRVRFGLVVWLELLGGLRLRLTRPTRLPELPGKRDAEMFNISIAVLLMFFSLGCRAAFAEGGCRVDFNGYDGPYFYSNLSYKKVPHVPHGRVDATGVGGLDAYYLVYLDSGRVSYIEKRLYGEFQWYKHYLYREDFLIVESNVLGDCSVLEVKLSGKN